MDTLSRRDFLAASVALGIAPLAPRLADGPLDHSIAPPARTTPSPVADRGAPAAIDDFFRDFTADWVRRDPSQATSSRYFSGAEQDALERQITPRTLESRQERIGRARDGLAQLRRFDRSTFTDLQRVSAEVMEWALDNVVKEEPWLDYTFPLEQMNGANVGLVETLTVRHPLLTERDAENYLAALGQVGARMDEATAEAKRLEARRFVPPRFILDATIRQMQTLADTPPAQNPFVSTFAERIGTIASLAAPKRERLRAEAERIVVAQIGPAWRRAIDALRALGAKATDDAGLWRLPNGLDAYAFFLGRFTTTPLAADQIHEIGLAQVVRIEGRANELLRGLGRTDGSVRDRLEQLKLDLQYPNPRSDASREQIMRDIEGIIRDAERRAADLFDKRPVSPVIARPFPTFREANAAANYNAPAADGSRPGTFQYPRRLENMTTLGLKSTVYHETVPGHHFQIALQVENKELPRFRQISAFGGISALTEGWALYAERLAAESGWYEGDVTGLIGQLYEELFRARRLVVDTGLHAQRWTRQQGIDYGIEASEVERYTVYAGQACSYMIGQLKLLELRDRSRQALGNRFSPKEFHNVVLATGTVPLGVMEAQVDRWIASRG